MKKVRLLKKGIIVMKGIEIQEAEELQDIFKGDLEISVCFQTKREMIIPTSPRVDIRDVALTIGENFDIRIFIPSTLSLEGCFTSLPVSF